MNMGFVLIAVFAVLSVANWIVCIIYPEWFCFVAFGLSLGILFTQAVETFKEKNYDGKFHNYRRQEQ
jgi:hypothetical protein